MCCNIIIIIIIIITCIYLIVRLCCHSNSNEMLTYLSYLLGRPDPFVSVIWVSILITEILGISTCTYSIQGPRPS